MSQIYPEFANYWSVHITHTRFLTSLTYELCSVWPIEKKWRISSYRSSTHDAPHCDVFYEHLNYLWSGSCIRICHRNESSAPDLQHVSPPRDASSLCDPRKSFHNLCTDNSSDFHVQIGRGVWDQVYLRRSGDKADTETRVGLIFLNASSAKLEYTSLIYPSFWNTSIYYVIILVRGYFWFSYLSHVKTPYPLTFTLNGLVSG